MTWINEAVADELWIANWVRKDEPYDFGYYRYLNVIGYATAELRLACKEGPNWVACLSVTPVGGATRNFRTLCYMSSADAAVSSLMKLHDLNARLWYALADVIWIDLKRIPASSESSSQAIGVLDD